MTNERKGKHLTFTERLQIEVALKQGLKPKEIASLIGKSVRTVYYELKRGTYQHKINTYDRHYGGKIGERYEERYSPDIAEEKYRQQLQAKGAPLKIGNDYALHKSIKTKNNPATSAQPIAQPQPSHAPIGINPARQSAERMVKVICKTKSIGHLFFQYVQLI